ncbi:MAG: hypothetical protein J0G94_01435 [Sphingomonadales bacterium]|nr:hypothetical protein [Sphingomonadales bacterium]
MNRALAALVLAALLAGCGSVTRLRPKEGMSAVPKAAAADRSETAAELMTPNTQAQPDRQADLLTRSTERKDDPFALPPGKNNGRVPPRPAEAAKDVPPPENTAQDKNRTGQGLPDTIDATDDRPDDPNAPAPSNKTP